MVDIHTHIIPSVDDGSIDISDSINILRNAKKSGYTAIVATPHYIEGSYIANNKEKNKLIEAIRSEAKIQNIDIEIYLGNEIFITENIEKLLNYGKVSSINNSRYILIELPRSGGTYGLQSCIFNLFSLGYIPIIAHPERYSFVQKNPNQLIDYIEQGVLFQLNSGSLLGCYGKSAHKTSKILLKHNMIHFIATDTHSSKSSSYDQTAEVYKLVSKLVGVENANNLMTQNPINVINNGKIVISQPMEYNKGLFDFIK